MRWFVLCLLLPVLLRSANAEDTPNIVLIYADDLGWTDLSVMGSRFYETPHIDSLARDGLLFSDAYACAPNCAPSRACLMSGKYTPRHGIFTVGDPVRGNHAFRRLEPAANKTVLDDKIITIAERLQTAGYRTASMGKWHLGKSPETQGFDINIAGREWGSPSGGGYHSPYRYPNLRQDETGEYLTTRLGDEAAGFIRENRDRRFFLYLTHYAVHTPIQGPKDLTKKYRMKPATDRHSNPGYAAMIEALDHSVGTVLQTLDDCDLRNNTVVIFYSDNGGHLGATRNTPLRGGKGMLYEGGIREPLLVRWPGRIPTGSKCDEPVIGVDFYPTLMELAGLPPADDPELDGVSLLPLFRDPASELDRPALFWHFPCYLQDGRNGPFRTTPAGAVRMGDWKLIEFFEQGHRELYNLKTDLGEAHNLINDHPARAQELARVLHAWQTQVRAPVPTTPNPRFDPSAKWTKRRRRDR